MPTLTLSDTVRSYPQLPYQRIKDVVLGTEYELSLVFLGATRARALNQRTRNKTYTPNVLSFPLTDTAGEIYITPTVARREATAAGMSEDKYTCYLFIHGLLHLAGYDHGPTMETLEEKYLKTFTGKSHN